MRGKLGTLIISLAVLFMITACTTGFSQTQYRAPNDEILDARIALDMLVEGNRRFADSDYMRRTTNKEDKSLTKDGQWPFAVIVTCSDSRVSPEIYFDQKLGDLFVIRNAGNIVDEIAMASIEFATRHLGAPLIVVVGHTSCVVVHNAHAGTQGLSANLQNLVNKMNYRLSCSACPETAVQNNVRDMVELIWQNDAVMENAIHVTGAIYDIETGKIYWLCYRWH
jgi:carbonic anhydrase